MNNNILYTALWAAITLTSAPAIAMDSETSVDAAPYCAEGEPRRTTGKRKASAAALIPSFFEEEEETPTLKKAKHARSDGLLSDTEKYRLKCKTCNRRFRHQSSLTYHMEADHTIKKIYACSDCNTKLKSSAFLTKHLASKKHKEMAAKKWKTHLQEPASSSCAKAPADRQLPLAQSASMPALETPIIQQQQMSESEQFLSRASDPDFLALPEPVIKQEEEPAPLLFTWVQF